MKANYLQVVLRSFMVGIYIHVCFLSVRRLVTGRHGKWAYFNPSERQSIDKSYIIKLLFLALMF